MPVVGHRAALEYILYLLRSRRQDMKRREVRRLRRRHVKWRKLRLREARRATEKERQTALKRVRNRLSVGSGPRPLRPGPRVNIAPRGRLGAATTTTTVAPSTDAEDASSEQTSSSSQEEAQPEEAQEVVTTPAPDALTRLRNRPRLRVSAVKPTSAPTAAPIRRPLIPRRKLGHPAEVKESPDAEAQDSSSDDTPASSEETSESSGDEVPSAATPEPEQPQGLASLVSGRRRGNALRRPRTLLPGGSRVLSQAS